MPGPFVAIADEWLWEIASARFYDDGTPRLMTRSNSAAATTSPRKSFACDLAPFASRAASRTLTLSRVLEVGGQKRRLGSIAGLQFSHDLPDMHLHRAFAHRQLVCDDLVRLAFAQQSQHLALTRRQPASAQAS